MKKIDWPTDREIEVYCRSGREWADMYFVDNPDSKAFCYVRGLRAAIYWLQSRIHEASQTDQTSLCPPHEWDNGDDSRCKKCGTKDWMT